MARRVSKEAMKSLLLEMMHNELDIRDVYDIAGDIDFYVSAKKGLAWAMRDLAGNDKVIGYHKKELATATKGLEETLEKYNIKNFGLTDLNK